jgi:hypothetical protein
MGRGKIRLTPDTVFKMLALEDGERVVWIGSEFDPNAIVVIIESEALVDEGPGCEAPYVQCRLVSEGPVGVVPIRDQYPFVML